MMKWIVDPDNFDTETLTKQKLPVLKQLPQPKERRTTVVLRKIEKNVVAELAEHGKNELQKRFGKIFGDKPSVTDEEDESDVDLPPMQRSQDLMTLLVFRSSMRNYVPKTTNFCALLDTVGYTNTVPTFFYATHRTRSS